MATSGPNTLGTYAAGATLGGDIWTFSSGTIWTFTDTNLGSNYLNTTNYGFSIPTGSTILGIQVDVEYYANVANTGGSGNRVTDQSVKILKGGTVGGTDMARARTAAFLWPLIANKVFVTYGGSSNLWGLTWAASDINATNFGCAFAGIGNKESGMETGFIDSARITITYTPPVSADNSRMFAIFP